MPSITRTRIAVELLLAAILACWAWQPLRAAVASDGAPQGGAVDHSLAGSWACWLDPGAVGLEQGWALDLAAGRRPATAPADPFPIEVPGPLEGHSASRDYDGTVFLEHRLQAPPGCDTGRVTLRFAQVNYACRVWLDGVEIGAHEGGYDAFHFDVSGRLQPGRTAHLAVMVVDPGALETFGWTLKTTPHAKESWYENHGGILGEVVLRVAPRHEIEDLVVRVDGRDNSVEIAGVLHGPVPPDGAPQTLVLEVQALGAAGPDPTAAPLPGPIVARDAVTVELPASRAGAPFTRRLTLPDSRRWCPESPALYRVSLLLAGERLAHRDVGFRVVELDGAGFRLDGRRRVLHGVLYQPHHTGLGGRSPPDEALAREAFAIRQAGFDLVRVHVRPAAPAFLRACDRLGLMVLQEPAIGWVDEHPELRARLEREIDWMVRRDSHHPSIVLWGVLNELSGRGFLHGEALAERLGAADPTRPVLQDSGGFLGGRFVPAGGGAPRSMIDVHEYPPWPLPPERRAQLAGLAGGPDEPVFVSEFGYGTLLDTERASAGFEATGQVTAERVLFRTFEAAARRARAAYPAWLEADLVALAARNQAEAAEDLVETLRSNPEVDLLCYTQWRAVSHESSAGLLEPWGEYRPAWGALRHALRPLMCSVSVDRTAVFAGDRVQVQVAVVNDGPAPVTAALELRTTSRPTGGTRTLFLADGPFAPGVTRHAWEVAASDEPGELELQAQLVGLEDVLDASTARTVPVLAPPLVPPALAAARVWTAESDEEARRALLRLGFTPTEALRAASAAFVTDPALLGGLPIDERLALWELVWRGGALVVLLPHPTETGLALHLGLSRGIVTLTGLPLPVAVVPAPGTFMGRLHVRRVGVDGLRPLGRADAALSPCALVSSALPADADVQGLGIGHLGNVIGAFLVNLPFGRGDVRCVGLPLLDETPTGRDALREAELLRLLLEALETSTFRVPAAEPVPEWRPDALELQAWQKGFDWIDAVVALGDRHSPAGAGQGLPPGLPAEVQAALDRRTRAVTALFSGRRAEFREELGAAVAAVWSEQVPAFLALEERVLAGLSAHAEAGGEQRWLAAWEVFESWSRGVAAWFDGQTQLAFDWLGRAELALGDA